MTHDLTDQVITATEVTDANQRLNFLPTFFGRNLMLVGENYVYNMMGKLSKSYTHGDWRYHMLSNGGFYMAPQMSEKMSVCWPMNYYEGEVSADAAGIIATLYALVLLTEQFQSEHFLELYNRLRDYVYYHPERNEINKATD